MQNRPERKNPETGRRSHASSRRFGIQEQGEYYRCREHLITFLEERAHHRPSQNSAPAAQLVAH